MKKVILIGISALVAFGCAAGIFVVQSNPEAAKFIPPSKASLVTKAAATSAKTVLGINEGTFIVGSDILPGTYKAKVPESSFGCYYERDKDTKGNVDSIIKNDNFNAGASVTIVIPKTDAVFTTSGCGVWMKVK